MTAGLQRHILCLCWVSRWLDRIRKHLWWAFLCILNNFCQVKYSQNKLQIGTKGTLLKKMCFFLVQYSVYKDEDKSSYLLF